MELNIFNLVTSVFSLQLFRLKVYRAWFILQIAQITIDTNKVPIHVFYGGLLSIRKYHKGTTVDVLYLRSPLVWLFSNVKFLENISDRAINITVCVVGALAAVGLLFLVF